MTPLQLIILGTILLLIGVLLPFLMVTKVIEPTMALSFLSHISSISGMIVGFWGVINYHSASNK